MSESNNTINLNTKVEPKIKNYGVAKDLEALDFPCDIKIKANNLYIDMQLGQKRDTKRRMAITFTIYQTYLDEDLYYDIVHIGNKVKLTLKQANASIPMYSIYLFHSKSVHHKGDVNIERMIDYYCGENLLNFDFSQIDEIKENYLLCKNANIKQGFSKKAFTAALIYYWMKIQSIPFDETKYVQSFPGVSLATVVTLYTRIHEGLKLAQ